MSKSLNFVVSIKLDKRSSDVNGNHPVKLRVWNRASKRVKLYSCNKFSDPSTFEKAMNHKTTVKGDTFVLRIFLEKVLSNAIDVLESNTVKSFDDFEKFMFGRTRQSAILSHYIDRKITECDKNQQYSSRDIYSGLKKLLERFSKGNSVEIVNLSVKWFESLESWYLSRKKGNGDDYKISGYSIYVRHLRIIINELLDEELISQKDYPFGKKKYTIPSAENNKRPLATDDISKLLNYTSTCLFKQYAVDFWKLSYYWMGINLRDVIKLQWNNIHDDKIYYYRSKTFKRSKVKKKNTIFIDDRTSAIIDKYKGTGIYIFNVLEESASEEKKYRAGKNFIRKINQHLKKVAVELNISTDISSIWSRHSFATEMKKKKVSPYIIQEAFGHKDIKTTENYMSSLVEDDLRNIQSSL
jgi:integrase